jgi:hypothetical protein
MKRIVTDALGFALTVQIDVREMDGRGQHRTYEIDGAVAANALHTIDISPDMGGSELIEVAAHEAYHLFYAVRDHIAVDEEIQATVFGQLVKQIVTIATVPEKPNAGNQRSRSGQLG